MLTTISYFKSVGNYPSYMHTVNNNNNKALLPYSKCTLHDELECSLALTSAYIYVYNKMKKWQINIRYRYKIYIVHVKLQSYIHYSKQVKLQHR